MGVRGESAQQVSVGERHVIIFACMPSFRLLRSLSLNLNFVALPSLHIRIYFNILIIDAL